MFDAESLLNTINTEAGDTKYRPVPVGVYPATVTAVEARELEDGRVVVDVVWELQPNKAVEEEIGIPNPQVRQSLFLDLTEDGKLDMGKGKNVRLNKLRAMFGLNEPGKPWRFQDFVGKSGSILVEHRVSDGGDIFAYVKKVIEDTVPF